MLLLSFFGMILLCIWVLLLFIPYDKWYNVHRWQDSKHSTAYLFKLLSRQFLSNFSKISLDAYLIFLLNQQGWKISSANHGAKHWKLWFFCIISTTLTKTGGGGTGCFVLQAAVPVLCWHFFNLNEKIIVKKKFFIFNS